MTNFNYSQWLTWRHITKLDPDRTLTKDQIEYIATSGTDALVIGGTQGIEKTKVRNLLEELSPYPLPKTIEVSSPEALVPGADLYYIPMVLNTSDPYWIIGAHQQTLKNIGLLINTQPILQEGYIILNPESEAAKLTKAITLSDSRDAPAYALCGEKLLSLPVIYLEYSGTFGNPDLVRQVKEVTSKSRLYYGGGIDSGEKAFIMAKAADTIVVGNMLYEGKLELLPETVRAVKEARAGSDNTPGTC